MLGDTGMASVSVRGGGEVRFFDETEMAKFDELLLEIERNTQDNGDLVAKLARYSVKATGDLSAFKSTHPLSSAYIDLVKAIHEDLIGKKHSSSLEGLSTLSAEHERDWPYPWGTRDASTVARFLIAFGFLIKIANLPPNARVLEVGCGVGSLTCNLARMGYRVDALDPNDAQCEIVRAATRGFPVAPTVISMTLDQWLAAKQAPYKYDAVIFFESFHHVIDHQACLEDLLLDHLEFDGKVLLAAEPVFERECSLCPYPWGPRLDGESMRAMRQWGWLEMGLTENYVRDLFKRFDLSFEWHKCADALPWSQVIVGHKPHNFVNRTRDLGHRYPSTFSDGIDMTLDGVPGFVRKYEGLAEREPWGRWTLGDRVQFSLAKKLPRSFSLDIELTDVFGPNVRKPLKVQIDGKQVMHILEPIETRKTYSFRFDDVDSDQIEILIPHPFRPKDVVEIGIEDPRRIGIGIRSIQIKAE
jgi:2-polyprenyl-3-methyl-5-hydroxy-6-metoxy-1,4-benzoquinol methylase